MQTSENQPEDVIGDAIARVGQVVNEAVVAAEQPGSELALTTDDAVGTKQRFAAKHSELARAQQAAAVATAEAKAVMQAKKAEFDAMMRAAELDLAKKMEELQPLIDQAERLKDGISALNLYLGRDEWIETLRTGTPAPVSEPLIIRQSVLAMDEESALNAENGGIDFRNIEMFDEWILADPANLDQVLPEQRGIVCIMPRRSDVDYGDAWMNDAMNRKNHHSWWLMRNGENVYRLVIEDFSVGQRLIPRSDEFTGLFVQKGWNGDKPIEPGSDAWMRAEKTADARTRHYMKIALVLQGLVARHTIFHPLPVANLNVLDQNHFDAGYVRLIADDENAIGSGRPDFHTWQRQINKQIRVGSRIAGHFLSSNPWKDNESHPIHPKYADGPKKLTIHTVTRNLGDGWFSFSYDRGKVITYDRYGYEKVSYPKGSYRFAGSDSHVIAIDFATPDDIRYYLNSRSERRSYLNMFPVLKAALRTLEAEQEAEIPFRALIASELCKTLGIDLEEAEAQTVELVRWWKTANKWNRALNGDQEAEAKAARVIINEAKRRAKAGSESDVDAAVVAAVKAAFPDVMVVARRTNDFIAAVPMTRPWFRGDDPENRYNATPVFGNVFVTLVTVSKTGKITGQKEWQTISRAQAAKWGVVFNDDRWAKWAVGERAADHLTDPQIEALIERVLEHAAKHGWVPFRIDMTAEKSSSYRLADGHLSFIDPNRTPTPLTAGQELTGEGDTSLSTFHVGFGITRDSGKFWIRDYESKEWWSRGETPWATDNRRYQGIWEDEAVIASLHDEAKVFAAAAGIRDSLYTTARNLVSSISDAWVTRADKVAYDRFMDDFADAELWEGHRKTLKIASPWKGMVGHHSGRSNSNWTDLTNAVCEAVEAGRDLSGLTVAEAFPDKPTADWQDDVAELMFPAAE